MEGWRKLEYMLCSRRCGCKICRCEINDLRKEKTNASIFLIPPAASLFWPLLSLSGSYIRSVLLYYLACSYLRFQEITNYASFCLGPVGALDVWMELIYYYEGELRSYVSDYI